MLAIVALLITGLVVGDPDNHGGNVGIIDPVMLLLAAPMIILAVLHPARRDVLRLRTGFKPASTALAIMNAIPLIVYAVNQALTQRNSWPPAADPHHNGHWMIMAMLAFAISLIGLLAARRADSQVPIWSSASAAFSFGLTSVLLPNHASSVGVIWGVASMSLGLLFVGTTYFEARQAGARRPGRLPRQLRKHEQL